MRSAACLVLMLGAIACGGETPTSPSIPILANESLAMRVQAAHLQIFAGPATPDATLRAAGDRLESEYARILSDLGVSSHPTVTVRIWQDASACYGELTRFFGTRNQATGYITGPTELRLLAGGNNSKPPGNPSCARSVSRSGAIPLERLSYQSSFRLSRLSS